MPPTPDLDADLSLALRAATAAGEAVLRFFGRDTPVAYKSPDQPVTEADLLADRVLRETLLAERPAYGWLSEETADSPARLARERVWIVDPIDGTRSFIQGYAEYAVSVALAVGGEALLGVVLNPSTGELFHAVRGRGAFRDGTPIRAAAPAPGERPVLFASRSDVRRGEFDALRESWRVEPLGSTAYKLVKVADGSGHAYLSRGPKSEWDVCAASLIVGEAGGQVTDLHGVVRRYNQPAPFLQGVIAAEAALHAELLRLAAVAPPHRRASREEV